MQLEMGMSTSRYLPASGTAGLERSWVRGNSRVPCPPPMMIESTFPILTDVNFAPGIKILLPGQAKTPPRSAVAALEAAL